MENKIVNQTVKHKTLGNGRITEYVNGYINAEFPSGIKRFKYPDSFESFLQFESEELQNEAASELKTSRESKQKSIPVPVKRNPTPVQKRTPKIPRDHRFDRMRYKEWEKMLPDYVIIQKEGFMYTAHNKSAETLSDVLGYEIITDGYGRVTTGGPDSAKIGFALESLNFKYIIIEDHQIVDQFDGK